MKNFIIFIAVLAAVGLVICAWINFPIPCAVTSAIILISTYCQIKKAPLMPADYNLD